MSLDVKLLARARERLAAIKSENSAQTERRRREIYSRIPKIKEIDTELKKLVSEIISASVGDLSGSAGYLQKLNEASLKNRSEKAELLSAAGYPADYLEDIYSCPKCRDSGVAPSGRPCTCLMELYKQEQVKELSSLIKADVKSFDDFDLSYYSDEPDPVLGVSPYENMRIVLAACRSYAETFSAKSPNLLFRGGTGLGKTFLSASIAAEVAARGFSVVYETAVSAFAAFEEQKFSRDQDKSGPSEKVYRMLNCQLLILDDLGTEMSTAFTQSALYTLVDSRLTAEHKTIISTNLSPAQLAERYTPQTVSRLNGEYDTLLFLGSDIRSIKKRQRYG